MARPRHRRPLADLRRGRDRISLPGEGLEHSPGDRAKLIDLLAAEVVEYQPTDLGRVPRSRGGRVNVATAYRHFANKHELAAAFLQHTLDRAEAAAAEAAAADDPWVGLTQFLEEALQQMTANRGLVDVLTRAYGTEWFKDRLNDLITGPIQRLVTRGQQAGVLRPDVDAADFAVILPMLSSVTGLAAPGASQLARRYLSFVLAGLRPADTPLEGRPPTDTELRSAIAISADGSQAGYDSIVGPTFRNEMRARGALFIPLNRPVTSAAKLRAPVFLVVAEDDNICPAKSVRAAAAKAGVGAEVLALNTGHFDVYTGDMFEKSVAQQVDFLQRTLKVSARDVNLRSGEGGRPEARA